jgi:hypothetical protein
MNESLIKAKHDLVFAIGDLRERLRKSDAVEALVLTRIITLVTEARDAVEASLGMAKERT